VGLAPIAATESRESTRPLPLLASDYYFLAAVDVSAIVEVTDHRIAKREESGSPQRFHVASAVGGGEADQEGMIGHAFQNERLALVMHGTAFVAVHGCT
jgi:hypothetical protein